MTKEEAIKRLKEYTQYSYGIWHDDEEDTKAFDIAIEALSAKPSGDLISRQWLLDLYEIDTTDFKETANVPLEIVIQNIKDAPTADVVSHEDYHNLLMASNDIDRALREYQDKEENGELVSIVRCKDCIHRIDRRLDLGHFMCEMFYGQGDVSDENFCQWGERRKP